MLRNTVFFTQRELISICFHVVKGLVEKENEKGALSFSSFVKTVRNSNQPLQGSNAHYIRATAMDKNIPKSVVLK